MMHLYKTLILTTLITLAFGASCQNPQTNFCRTAAKNLCAKAYTCGENAIQSIGIVNEQQIEECVSDIVNTCTALDGAYSVELSRTCLTHIDEATCTELITEGKPDSCNRLF